MKTYLELESKCGNQPCTNVFLPNTNSSPRKTPAPKKAEKKIAKVPVKRRFKMRVITQPISTNPTLPVNPILPAEPTPTVATSTVTTQMPVAKSAATSIPVTVYNLAQGKFKGIPYHTTKYQEGEGPSTTSCNDPQEQQSEAAITATAPQNREDTPWPNTMPVSTNLFNAMASLLIPPAETPAVVKMERTEVPPREVAIPHALVLNKPQSTKPAEEECRWGLHCPICTKYTPDPKEEGVQRIVMAKGKESQQRNHYSQSPQHPPAHDFPDRFSQQNNLEKQWNERTECPNEKYNLDYFSSSESDYDFESEHKHETLI